MKEVTFGCLLVLIGLATALYFGNHWGEIVEAKGNYKALIYSLNK